MENVFDFMSSALPWIAMGLLLAVFFVRAAARKKGKGRKEDHGSEGMAMGMCFGVALATALHINTGLGMMTGMVLGLLIGSSIEKKNESDSKTENNDGDHE